MADRSGLGIDAERLEEANGRGRAIVEALSEEHRIDAPMERMAAEVYVPLALWIADRQRAAGRPLVVGVHGAQGSGKSTLAAMLGRLLPELTGLRAATFSLDDIYLERGARAGLAAEIHPLLQVRGVPGTHEVGLGLSTLDALTAAGPDARTPLPSFDKAVDDRRPASEWPLFEGSADVILFEGWCVGVPPQQAGELDTPINTLEADEDPEGVFRRHVNERLEDEYARLWGRLDALIMLEVPSMEQVLEWRLLQESKLREAREGAGDAASAAVMSEAEVERFVMFFERLTRHALKALPALADVVVRLGADHLPLGVEAQ